jgi:putative S-methylcysteine transport system substrate-binding protein
MRKRLVLLLAMVVAVMLGLTACGSSEPTEITVVAGNLYPVIYTDDDGNITGFEHDLIEEIAKRENMTVKWEQSDDYTAMFAGLDSGAYTTIAGQVSWTEDRAKTYNFSDKYTANEIKMCVRADDSAKTLDDLQGRKVCIEYGTVLETFFNNYNKKHKDNPIKCVTTSGSAYEELQSKHFDAFPITVLSFDQSVKKNGYDFKLIGDPIITDYQAFPFSKDTDTKIIDKFNDAMKEMREDGTMKKLSKKYFGHDFTSFDQDEANK